MQQKHVIIVGGGITGLSAAYHLQEEAEKAGISLTYTLIESDNRLGGKIKTEYPDGFTIDGGPDCFLSRKPWALAVARKLGLDNQLMGTNDHHRKTFVLNKGKLTPLPDGVLLIIPTRMVPFATSTLISWPGKIRMGMDMFIPPRKGDDDETVANFVRRRLGQEALDKIAEPLMSGIHISDPENQSLLGSFPRFREIEVKYGSLIRGMLQQRKATAKAKHLKHNKTSRLQELSQAALHGWVNAFTALVGAPVPDKGAIEPWRPGTTLPLPMFITMKKGLGQLVQGIVDSLHGELVIGKQAARLDELSGNGTGVPRYRITTNDGKSYEGDAIILATPAYVTADLLSPINRTLADDLRRIRYVTTSTVSMGFRLEDVGKRFDGFGFVIPRKENRRMTGCTWSSTKFNFRATPDKLLLRCFIGGPGHEHLAEQDDETLITMVREELRDLMGLTATPIMTRVYRWTKANPQYDVGHLDRVSDMFAVCEQHHGLFMAGSAYQGVGVPDCIHQGQQAAQKVMNCLQNINAPATHTLVEA